MSTAVADTENFTGAYSRPSYRLEIDGLRALAVVAVIISHFDSDILPCGYLGVDIFFVISGFVITSSLAAGRPDKSFVDLFTRFYTRRIKRLVPALVLNVFITSILICLFDPDPRATVGTGITALFGVSNLYLLEQSVDYFASSTQLNVFTQTWSLGVEEQFYLLFPCLVWITGFGRLPNRGARALLWSTCALSAASWIGFTYCYQSRQSLAYFLMVTRFWELGAGCMLFLGLKHSNGALRRLEKIPPAPVLAALLGVLFVPPRFAVPATIAVVCLTAALIASIRTGSAVYHLLTRPPVVYVGLISYSLYLWHWSVLSLSRWTVGIHGWSAPFQLALMLLLAAASYRYVETPLRLSEWSARRWHSIGYGIGTCACVGGLLTALIKMPDLSLFTGRTPSLVATGVSSLVDPYLLNAAGTRWEGEKCVLSDNAQVGKKISIEECTLGHFSTARKRIVLVGNSFTAAFAQAFDDLVVRDGYSVTITSSWGASAVEQIPNGGPWSEINDYYWKSVVPGLISRLERGDQVFLVNDMSGFSPERPSQESSGTTQRLESGLEILSNRLSAQGIRLVVLHGLPFAREANCQPAIAIEQWFAPFGNRCKLPNRRASLVRREALSKALISLEQKGKIRIVDLFDIFCPGKECTYFAANGQLLYRDEWSHPSVEAARLSAPTIRHILTASD